MVEISRVGQYSSINMHLGLIEMVRGDFLSLLGGKSKKYIFRGRDSLLVEHLCHLINYQKIVLLKPNKRLVSDGEQLAAN